MDVKKVLISKILGRESAKMDFIKSINMSIIGKIKGVWYITTEGWFKAKRRTIKATAVTVDKIRQSPIDKKDIHFVEGDDTIFPSVALPNTLFLMCCSGSSPTLIFGGGTSMFAEDATGRRKRGVVLVLGSIVATGVISNGHFARVVEGSLCVIGQIGSNKCVYIWKDCKNDH
jgi:hypothetical protein